MARQKNGKRKFEFTPAISPECFVEQNEEYYVNSWLEDHPWSAWAVNDWDLDGFYDDVDRDWIKETMVELYQQRLEDNF